MAVSVRPVMPWHRRPRRPRPPTSSPRRLARLVVAVLVSLAATASVAAPARSAPSPVPEPGGDVVVQWDRIALRTVYAEHPTTGVPRGALYLGYVQLAVYDAVVAVEGGYEPFLPRLRARPRASSEVAAVTAAHRTLRHFFPASAAALDADYAATIATLPRGAARAHGTRVGEAAAAAMVASRVADGREDTVTLAVDPAPGVWQPTPPALAPMAFAEMGFVRPLVLASPTALPLPGPDAVTSPAYAADYAEVKAYGALAGSARTPAQTATATFWNANVTQQYHLATGTEVLQRDLGIVEAARAFGMLGAATHDAVVACWRAKYDHAYWRPVTAIRAGDTDGNDATVGDPAWTSLLPAPPYPDYPSGHGCLTGAASGVLGHLFGAGSIDVDVPFPTDPTVPSRHFATSAALDAETMDARIYLGFHFRRAMTDANALGHAVADVAAPRFDPVG